MTHQLLLSKNSQLTTCSSVLLLQLIIIYFHSMSLCPTEATITPTKHVALLPAKQFRDTPNRILKSEAHTDKLFTKNWTQIDHKSCTNPLENLPLVHIKRRCLSVCLNCLPSLPRRRTCSRWWSWRRRWTADLPQWCERLRLGRHIHTCTLKHKKVQKTLHRKPSTVQRWKPSCITFCVLFMFAQTHSSPGPTPLLLLCSLSHASCALQPLSLYHWAIGAYHRLSGGINHLSRQETLPRRTHRKIRRLL